MHYWGLVVGDEGEEFRYDQVDVNVSELDVFRKPLDKSVDSDPLGFFAIKAACLSVLLVNGFRGSINDYHHGDFNLLLGKLGIIFGVFDGFDPVVQHRVSM